MDKKIEKIIRKKSSFVCWRTRSMFFISFLKTIDFYNNQIAISAPKKSFQIVKEQYLFELN